MHDIRKTGLDLHTGATHRAMLLAALEIFEAGCCRSGRTTDLLRHYEPGTCLVVVSKESFKQLLAKRYVNDYCAEEGTEARKLKRLLERDIIVTNPRSPHKLIDRVCAERSRFDGPFKILYDHDWLHQFIQGRLEEGLLHLTETTLRIAEENPFKEGARRDEA